jgi:hypothetical protein
MTPKEKSKNLYDEFHSVLPSYNDEGQLEHKSAKRCALIAVDELIKLYEILKPHRGFKISYLDEVKQELEKL